MLKSLALAAHIFLIERITIVTRKRASSKSLVLSFLIPLEQTFCIARVIIMGALFTKAFTSITKAVGLKPKAGSLVHLDRKSLRTLSSLPGPI